MFHPLHASFPLVSNVASPKVKEGRLSHMARKGSPIWGSPAAVFLVQIVFLADAFFVVFVPPMQLVDAVHQPFVIAFLNSVDDEGVFLLMGERIRSAKILGETSKKHCERDSEADHR